MDGWVMACVWGPHVNPVSVASTHPPLLVLLPVHHDHLALGEGQLVWIVRHTVEESLHPLRPLFLCVCE